MDDPESYFDYPAKCKMDGCTKVVNSEAEALEHARKIHKSKFPEIAKRCLICLKNMAKGLGKKKTAFIQKHGYKKHLQ